MNPAVKRVYGILDSVGKLEKHVVFSSLALISLISFIYFYWFGQGVFLYQENRSLFIFSNEYLQKYIIKPGGLLEYAGNFITQFYHNRLFGSLINTAFLLLLFIVLLKINRHLSGGSFSLLIILFPVCILLFIQTRYTHSITNSLGYFLLVTYFLATILGAGKRYNLFRLTLFPLFYYITGSFALLFTIMHIIYSIIYEKRIRRYLLPVIIAAITVVSFVVYKDVIFFQTGEQLLSYPLPFIEVKKLPVLYNILCVWFIFFPLLVKIPGFRSKIKYSGPVKFTTLLVVLVMTVIMLVKKYDHNLSVLFQIERSVYKQDWDEVIRLQERSLSTNSNCQYYYNLALAERGTLCSRMFFGPQNFRVNSLILKRSLENINRIFYFYYSIGLTGEAHHLAYESMVVNGYRPENTKMLIKTELINGNYKIAERYLNVLKRTLYYRSWALKYEKMLFNPDLVNSDPELGEKIRSLPQKDFFIRPDDFDNIESVLKINPNDKRTFEYKLARMLLEKDLKAIVSEARKMKEIGYTSIPRHIEEAILIFMNATREFPDLGGLLVNPETSIRFNQYISVYNLNIRNKQLLDREIKKVGGNTYWYYYQFK